MCKIHIFRYIYIYIYICAHHTHQPRHKYHVQQFFWEYLPATIQSAVYKYICVYIYIFTYRYMYISICELTFENVYLPPNAPDFARAWFGIHISRKSVVKFFYIVNSGIGRLLRMSPFELFLVMICSSLVVMIIAKPTVYLIAPPTFENVSLPTIDKVHFPTSFGLQRVASCAFPPFQNSISSRRW